jgi:hypothetical protein
MENNEDKAPQKDPTQVSFEEYEEIKKYHKQQDKLVKQQNQQMSTLLETIEVEAVREQMIATLERNNVKVKELKRNCKEIER